MQNFTMVTTFCQAKHVPVTSECLKGDLGFRCWPLVPSILCHALGVFLKTPCYWIIVLSCLVTWKRGNQVCVLIAVSVSTNLLNFSKISDLES